MKNKTQLQEKLTSLKTEIAKVEEELNKVEDPTARQWLEEFIQKPFDKVEVNIKNQTITYYRNGQWVFQQDRKNGYLSCYYYEVWAVLQIKYHMKDTETQELIKDVVGEAFNCKELTPELTPVVLQ